MGEYAWISAGSGVETKRWRSAVFSHWATPLKTTEYTSGKSIVVMCGAQMGFASKVVGKRLSMHDILKDDHILFFPVNRAEST